MNYILNRPQKILCVVVFLATCLASLLECLGVSVIIPVINAILNPQQIMKSPLINKFTIVRTISENQIVFLILLGVVLVYLFKNIYFIFLSWLRIKFSCKIQREISIKMMKSYMSRGYQFFLENNFGELNRGVAGDTVAVYSILYTGFRLISDLLTILLLCVFMFLTDWSLSFAMMVVSLVCIVLIYFVFRKQMYFAGKEYRKYSAYASQAILQAFQGIKDVMVLRKQKYFVNEYEKNQIQVQIMQCKQTVGQESPAYIIEGMCVTGFMGMIAVKMLCGSQEGVDFVATLGAFAMAAFRILPSLGRISISMNQVISNIPSINAVYENIKEAEVYALKHPEIQFEDLKEPKLINRENVLSSSHVRNLEKKGYEFQKRVELNSISFRYNEELEYVLENINITIEKGQAIAIIGASGSGKSTLVDIILGLLVPVKGTIYVDGKSITNNPDSWSRIIGYVPQSVFLSDDSILGNVAFGEEREQIDISKVWEAIERAELGDFVRSLPEGINTFVGDRGVRLSGGQRQRIAIARALYHEPQILVLDEATSALDNDTEAAIMSAIDSLQGHVTLIIVAHRLTTVRNCDVIYEVVNKRIQKRDKKDVLCISDIK